VIKSTQYFSQQPLVPNTNHTQKSTAPIGNLSSQNLGQYSSQKTETFEKNIDPNYAALNFGQKTSQNNQTSPDSHNFEDKISLPFGHMNDKGEYVPSWQTIIPVIDRKNFSEKEIQKISTEQIEELPSPNEKISFYKYNKDDKDEKITSPKKDIGTIYERKIGEKEKVENLKSPEIENPSNNKITVEKTSYIPESKISENFIYKFGVDNADDEEEDILDDISAKLSKKLSIIPSSSTSEKNILTI